MLARVCSLPLRRIQIQMNAKVIALHAIHWVKAKREARGLHSNDRRHVSCGDEGGGALAAPAQISGGRH